MGMSSDVVHTAAGGQGVEARKATTDAAATSGATAAAADGAAAGGASGGGEGGGADMQVDEQTLPLQAILDSRNGAVLSKQVGEA